MPRFEEEKSVTEVWIVEYAWGLVVLLRGGCSLRIFLERLFHHVYIVFSPQSSLLLAFQLRSFGASAIDV